MKKINFNVLYFFLIWIIFTFWIIIRYDKSLFSLSYGHPDSSFTEFSTDKILAGESIKGNFMGQQNNLGTISIHFKYGERVAYNEEDQLIFRLKEKNTKPWIYENTYRSGMIYDSPMFPFGFPVIKNSKNKVFEFELMSTKGNKTNALTINKSYPTLESRYVPEKSELLNSPIKIINFLIFKFVSKISNLDIVFVSLILMIPLVTYLVWVVFLFKFSKTSLPSGIIEPYIKVLKKMYPKRFNLMQESYFLLLSIFLCFAVILDVIFINSQIDLIFLIVFLLWSRVMINNKLSDILSGIFSILLICLIPILISNDSYLLAIKSASWALVFFALSIFFAIQKARISSKIE